MSLSDSTSASPPLSPSPPDPVGVIPDQAAAPELDQRRSAGHQRWSLRTSTRWAAVIAVVISMMAVIGGGAAILRLNDARDRVVNQLDPAIRAALNLSNALVNEETGVRGFALSAQEDFLAPYAQGQQAEQAAVRDLVGALGRRFQQADADLRAVQQAAQRWQTGYAEPTIAAVRASRTAASSASVDQGKRLFDDIRTALARQATDLERLQHTAQIQLRHAATLLLWTWVAVAIALLGGMTALSVTVRGAVTRPLTAVADQVRRVARGDFNQPILAAGPAEIVELGDDVDSMRRRIVAELTTVQQAHTDLDEQARELRRSNSELEQFAYVASHDLQEPLRKVASFCQLLEARYPDKLDDRGRQYINFAVDGATRMQTLINDLLAFSRVGRLRNEHTVLDGNQLFATAKANLAAVIEDTDAVIESDDLPALEGDASLLVAVLQNLISNAIKFRAPDRRPRIHVTAHAEDDQWLFTCSDNSIGIEAEYAERIFVIFQRLHPKGAYAGTGIGLAMCRKIIEYHGGRIWLDTTPSEDSTPGSTFRFTLPRVHDQSTTPLQRAN